MNRLIPEDRRYSRAHQWAREDGGQILIGLSGWAVRALGELTELSLDVKPGDAVQAGRIFGTIESDKALSDLISPVSGRVTRVNARLPKTLTQLRSDPYDAGWMIAIEPGTPAELTALLDAQGYQTFLRDC